MMRLPFKPVLIAAGLAVAPLLAACHSSHTSTDSDVPGSKVAFTMKDGSLTLRRQIVIIKISGHDPAYVTTHGHLVIGNSNDNDVPVNDEQRAALVAYNRAANEMISKGIDVGVEGAHVAADAIGIVIKDAVNGNTQDIDKDVKKGVQPIKSKVDELCDQLDAWRKAQGNVAHLIPVFEPYAIIGDADIKECRDHGFQDDDDNADDNDDDDDKPSSPGEAVHDSIKKSIHGSLSKSYRDSVIPSSDGASGSSTPPPSSAASRPAAPTTPVAPSAKSST